MWFAEDADNQNRAAIACPYIAVGCIACVAFFYSANFWEKLVTAPTQKPRSTYYRAFTRDKFCCVYCGKNILESFDSFASSHLDHLKPSSAGGPDEDVCNRVTACGICNSLKGAYDPAPGEHVTEANFTAAVANARDYIQKKRNGEVNTSYFRDYQYWLEESAKIKARL